MGPRSLEATILVSSDQENWCFVGFLKTRGFLGDDVAEEGVVMVESEGEWESDFEEGVEVVDLSCWARVRCAREVSRVPLNWAPLFRCSCCCWYSCMVRMLSFVFCCGM